MGWNKKVFRLSLNNNLRLYLYFWLTSTTFFVNLILKIWQPCINYYQVYEKQNKFIVLRLYLLLKL